jgi:hypothetical protein
VASLAPHRVGLPQAQGLWDQLVRSPGTSPPTANTCYLRGKACRPPADGGDPHAVVAILTINYSSH